MGKADNSHNSLQQLPRQLNKLATACNSFKGVKKTVNSSVAVNSPDVRNSWVESLQQLSRVATLVGVMGGCAFLIWGNGQKERGILFPLVF